MENLARLVRDEILCHLRSDEISADTIAERTDGWISIRTFYKMGEMFFLLGLDDTLLSIHVEEHGPVWKNRKYARTNLDLKNPECFQKAANAIRHYLHTMEFPQ